MILVLLQNYITNKGLNMIIDRNNQYIRKILNIDDAPIHIKDNIKKYIRDNKLTKIYIYMFTKKYKY